MRVCILFVLLATAAHAALPPVHPPTQTLNLGAPAARINGYTLDKCDSEAECKGDRHCVLGTCILDSSKDKPCTACSDCEAYVDKHEVCAEDDKDKVQRCMSATHASELNLPLASDCEGVESTGDGSGPAEPEGLPTAPLPSVPPPEDASGTPGPTQAPPTTTAPPTSDDDDDEEETAVCIAVHHLGHLATRDLVFDSHVRASVLCDANDSCATPGHIVVFRARAMMMRSYCAVARGGCTRRRALVNSPRFSRKVVVPSTTEGLHFTALAARFETELEEHALKLAIRVGL